MARDYYDESKKKKKETTQKKVQSPSVSKKTNTARTQQAQQQKTSGGVQTVKKPTTAYRQRSARQTQQANAQNTNAGMQRTQTAATSRQRRAQRQQNAERNNNLKQRQIQTSTQQRQQRTQQRQQTFATSEEMRKARQAQKSGIQNDINDNIQQKREQRRTEAQKIKSGQYESKNTAVDKWDRDIADTITHTMKQSVAEDKTFINTAFHGITQKGRDAMFTPEQNRKADEKYEKRRNKYESEIENEGKSIEEIQKGHSYLGKQALSAVSSTTGMAMDIAVGAATGTGQAGSLSHMFMRSAGGTQGQVRKQASALRSQLEKTGAYEKEELDEMFKNVDAMDELNALASGGIELATELAFPGFGIARKAIGGKGMSIAERAGAKLLKNAGGKASSGFLKNMLKGTAEEVAEEEMGGPAQAFAANLIYGNKFQSYNEDAVKRSLKAQSDELRSQIKSEDDARQVAARLGSSSFLNESRQAYIDSGLSDEQATMLAEMSRDYLSASLSGDIDKAKATQDEMVKALSGGENSFKEKFTLKDALDAAVSTTMMTMGTGAIGAMNSANVGRAFKGTAGMDAVRQQAEIIRNWGDSTESSKAQAVMDRIDAGEDISDTQVYELIQGAAEAAEQGYKDEETSRGTAAREMKKRDLRISPIQQDGTLAPQTAMRYDNIVSQTVSRYSSLAKLGQISEMDAADIELGADIGAAMETGVITAEQINELARGSAAVKTVFQDVTGINLDQFSVNDRNGNIDISETNKNMRQAIMAEAAHNMVNSARLEQVAWNSEARGAVSESIAKTISGNSNLKRGYASTIEALQTVDPRDRDTFMLMGNAAENVYEYAYNTQDTWDDVKGTYRNMYPSLSMSALKGIYDSAKMDKIEAETPFLNAKVKAGEALDSLAKGKAKAVVRGKFENTTPLVIARDGVYGRELTDDEQLVCVSLAEQFNANITMIDAQDERLSYTTPDGKKGFSNAYVDLKNGEIFIGNAADIGKIVHEVTHMGARLASDKYLDMAHYIMDKAYKFAPERTKAMVEAYKRTYAGQNLTDAQIEEELVSDLVAVFSDDAVFIREISQEQPSLAKRIYNAILDVLHSLRNILATGRIQDPAVQESFLEEIGAYEEARQMWLRMMAEARANNAAIGLDEWENESFRDTRESREPVETEAETTEAEESPAISEEQIDALNESGVDVTESGTVVRYSLESWMNTDIEDLKARLRNAGYGEDRIEAWVNDVNSISALILGDMERLNYAADQFQDALKPNAEYYYTLDLSTLCQKRRLYQGTYNKIMRYLVNRVLMPEDTVRLRAMMDEMGYQVPCGICYEESRKKNEGKFAERWLNGYGKRWKGYKNQEHTDPYIPTLAEVTTTDGREKLRAEHPEAYESYVNYQKTRGSANPKISYTHTDYRGDILRMSDSDIQKVKHIGGLRIQSFSDFEIPHVIDMMQAVMDMSAQELTAQAYTKVPAFAEIFGGTGIKINLSLIGRWNEETQELEFDAKEGIDPEQAFKLRNKYSQNVGTILVGADDISILKAWADPRVDMVIPFHRSGWSKKEFEKLGLVGYKDYTKGQTERYMMGKKDMALSTASKALGLTRDEKLQPIYSADYWDTNLTGKENAERYLALCAEKHYRPVFYQFLHDNGDGTWSLQEDGSTDGYWKSLIDFKMYDNDGNYAPQELVQPTFDMDAAQKFMDEYEGGADTLPVAEDVVTEFLKEYKQNHPNAKINIDDDVRMSISVNLDDAYMSAVESGNMDEAQRLVDEAANVAGFKPVHRYHGTMDASFTVFDKAYAKVGGNSGAGFYFSTSRDDSEDHYQDVEGADNYFKWSELAEQINQQIEEGTWEGPELETYEDVEEYAKKQLNKEPGTFDVYLNYKNPYVRNYRESTNIYDMLMDDFDESVIDRDDYEDEYDYEDDMFIRKTEHIAENVDKAVRGAIDDLENFYDYVAIANEDEIVSRIAEQAFDFESVTWDDIKSAIEMSSDMELANDDWDMPAYGSSEFTRAIIENLGYDAIEDKEVSSKFGQLSREMATDTEHIIVFKPEQIKLSDPVTYAEDGSVIPLSERFDSTNNDIRYSLPTQDADGNILSDGQMEYFKNSQARDDQGRLVPVYHTTNMGGFTIFDPMRSDDHRSLFFSSDLDVSLTYANDSAEALDFASKDLHSWDDLIKYGRQLFNDSDMSWGDDVDENNLEWELYDKTSGDWADIDYDEWLGLVESNDPRADDYRVKISLPYSNEDGETESVSFEGDSVEELLSKVSNGGVPHAGYYQVYLNLENPMVIDAYGQNWDSIALESSVPNDMHLDLYTPEYLDEWADREDEMYKAGQAHRDGARSRSHAEAARENDSYVLKTERGDFLYVPMDEDEMGEVINEYYGLDTDSIIGITAASYLTTLSGDFDRSGRAWANASIVKDYVDEGGMDTRAWAAQAQAEGYDGLIIRNVVDIGDESEFAGDELESDIYVAFSSNQVKDIRNENPSENPDIRYSKTDPDEAMSKMAHDYAYDTSHEALEYYESIIDNLSDSETYQAYNKAKKMADVDKFYAGLQWYADGMKFDDPILEEGRERMASSKADFFSRNNAKWNPTWLTEGRVLDDKSVRKPVRELVMRIMAHADTPAKYKTDVVNKTIVDVRLAYDYAKQGRTEIADALLWHSALRMIENVDFIDDEVFNSYKDLRDYLRTTRITLNEEYWADIDYQAFRKANFNRINLVSGEQTNVDQVYQELCELYPEFFKEDEEMTPPDQLARIEQVLNSIQPYRIAYSSEEAAEFASDIASELFDIMQSGSELKSFADKAKEKTAEAVAAERARAEERLARQQEEFDHDAQALKARHKEAMRDAREKVREAEKKKANAKFKEYKDKQREKKYHDKYFKSIKKSYDTLVDRLRTNTKDKHIPEQYKRELAALLAAFDFQTVRSKKLQMKKGPDGYERLDMSRKTINMRMIQSALKKIEADTPLFNVNDSITDIIVELTGMYENGYREDLNIDGKTLDELNSQQLKQIDKLLKALIHEFNNYENVRAGNRKQKAADIGGAQIETSLAYAEKYGKGSDYYGIRGAIDKLINLDEVTPAYLFRQIDPEGTGLGLMFKELRTSFDKYVRNQEQLSEWMNEIVGEYHDKGFFRKYGSGELEKWRSENYAQTIELESGKSVKLTPAQMMSIHCLARRTQAYNHMVGDGIVVKPVSFQAKLISDLKKKADYSLPVKLTDTDIRNIEQRLTKEQMDVADKLQQLMATKMAAWGNEASMAVIGINLFEDPDYFPIKSDRAALEEDFTAEQFTEMIRSFGFAKAVAPNAKNAIAIDDIFDVVTEHCNNMNLYNAYSESMNDFMKVYNYKQAGPDSVYSVRQAVAHGHSKKATTYISTFLQDLNGNVSRGRDTGIDQMMQDALGKAKKASVFANGRVALQQPTAIVRAFAVIDPKYLKGVKVIDSREAMQEMFDRCPIALWKSWGYYDINMGKSIEDLIMNNGSMAEDAMTDIYGRLDNKTWSVIWQMVKNEVREQNPELKENTDEFYDKCNERMTEVVDLTQVVDSPFHRSHAMRDKSLHTKMFTAFMAEPTLTFNMVRDGYIRAVEARKAGDKAKFHKIMGRTASVFVLQAATVSAAAAIWDAVRKKKPDKDDDDDRLLHLWWVNCVENFKDNINLFKTIYYAKDIWSIAEGWDQKNLGLQGFVHLRDAYNQLTGNKKVSSKMTWLENALSGIGYLTGVPFKTLINDTNAIWEWIGWKPGVVEFAENWAESVQDMNGGEAKGSGFGSVKSTGESEDKSSGKANLHEGQEVKSWTYENAPIHIKDGSLVDNFLNSMGYNLTASEINAIEEKKKEAEKQEKINSIIEKTQSLSGETKDKKVWSYVTAYMKAQNEDIPITDVVQSGDYGKIGEYRAMYTAAGGDPEYFNQRIYDLSKTALKKSISSDNTPAQIEQQNRIKDYLLRNGMEEAEMSDIAYHSYTARDLKAAIMLNDADAAVTELRALLQAGMTDEDFYRLWDNRKKFNIMNYKKNGKYKDRFKSTGTYKWAANGSITSRFGPRSSPGGIGSTYHQGIDIGGSTGDPISASDGGVVIMAKWYGGYGKTVQIQHDDGTITQYSHLSWWDAQVGDVVGQGQVIGKMGSTGNSTGPHLHFGVIKDGRYVDPMKYLQK